MPNFAALKLYMMKLLLLPFLTTLSIAAFSQANSRFSLVNDAFYGGPTIEGLKLRYKLGVLWDKPANKGYEHLHLGHVVGPTGLRTEFFITDRIGIGTDAIYNYTSGRFSRHEEEFNASTGLIDTVIHAYEFTTSHVRIQGRINFHKRVKSKKLDVYTGLGFGSNTNVVKLTRDKQEVNPRDFLKSNGLKFSARACFGFRWYPAKPVGINFEFGIGGPLVSAGVSSRFALKKPEMPQLTNPTEDSDNLKRKKDELQEKQNMEEKLRNGAQEQIENQGGSQNAEKLREQSNEKERQRLEEEKLKLEQEKLELEREKLQLERQKLEEEKKRREEEKNREKE
jgi:hypothetical protein